MRHPPLGPERLAEPRGDPPGGHLYWIVDLGSTNGVEREREARERRKLEDGDRITLGSTELVFARDDPR